jgi:hypothetical protein
MGNSFFFGSGAMRFGIHESPEALIADKAYDADPLIIPPKSNRKTKRDCDFALYRKRNLISAFSDLAFPPGRR